MLVRFLSTVAIVTGLVFGSSAALATDWTVANTSANVRFTVDKTNWQAVKGGMKLPNNAWIDTGKRGRVTLSRGKDTINLNPGTLAGVFDLGGPLDKTVVTQQTGTVALNVTHKWAPWMSVKTPYLAALVKGTKFEVSISGKKAKVSVERGIVEVTDNKHGDRVDVVAGQAASVDATGNQTMTVTGAGATAPETKATKKAAETKDNKSDSTTETENKGNSENSGKSHDSSEGSGSSHESSGNNGNGNPNGNGNSNSNGNGNGNSGGNGNGNSNESDHSEDHGKDHSNQQD